MSRAKICPLLLSVSLSFAGCSSYSGIHGEAQTLSPQSLALHYSPSVGDWPRAASPDAARGRLVLATGVAQTSSQTQTDLAALAVARQTLAHRESLLELNRVRASRGLEAAIALRQSDQQIAASRVEVSAAEAAVQLDRHQLAALLGLGPDAPLEVEPALRPYGDALVPPANRPADLLARRPDIAAPRLRGESAAAPIR